MKPLLVGAVACVIAVLLHLSLDAGSHPGGTPRAFSLPLVGLGLIFAARAWTLSMSGDQRMTSFFAGLAVGVAGYGIVRLFLV